MKILIVDDNEEDRYLLEVLLRGHGYDVESAADGVEALEKASQDGLDMIIADILMPRMDGFQLCRKVKTSEKLKNIAFVFYTATYTDPKDEQFALSLGVEKFIVKPTEPDVFIEILREVIRSYETGTLIAPKPPVEEETVYLKEYNERLVNKLEDKVLQLENANKVLGESERKYRELIEIANDAVVVVEPTGYLSFVNPKFCDMTGYSVEEAKKLHFSKLVHPEDLTMVTENFRKRLSGEEVPRDYEFQVLTKAGETIYIDYNSSTIEREGKIVGILGIIRDITERKRADEKIKQAAEEWKVTFDSIADLVSIHDKDFKLTRVNKTYADTFKMKPGELIGKTCYEVFHGTKEPPPNCPHKQTLETKEPCTAEFFEPHLGVHFEFSTSPMFNEKGEVTGSVHIAKDITERKQAEEEIRRNYDIQNMLNSLLRLSLEDFSLEGIMMKALELILSIPWLTLESSGSIFLVEDDPAVLVMKAQNKLEKPILEACARLPFGRCLCGRAALTQEIQFADHVDERHDIRYKGMIPHGHYCVPILFAGKTLGVINTYSKEGRRSEQRELEFMAAVANTLAGIIMRKRVEEQKHKVETQLLQSQKMEAVGRLAGGVAHDFNNLLTAIIGYSELVLGRLGDDDPIRQDVEEIKKAGDRAALLTRQLLAFSRKQVLQPEVMDLNSVVSDIDKMLRRVIGEDITLVTILASKLIRIRADRGQVEQVIMNLAVNSRDAMPEGGKLTIKTENVTLDEDYCKIHPEARPGRFVCLSVEDTGVGIDKEVIEHIFEPFFSTKEPGTGLGLSVVYGIVKQHEGWINVYSEPGQGTTFRIYLPTISIGPEEETKEKISLSELQGSGQRILLVEDEAGVREFTSRVLRENSYIVLEAATAEEALSIFEKEKGKFHLIFSDVVLPDKTGLQLVDQLLAGKPKLTVMMSSGYTDQRSLWPTIKEKGFRFLQKPYSLTDLLRAVKETIEQAE